MTDDPIATASDSVEPSSDPVELSSEPTDAAPEPVDPSSDPVELSAEPTDVAPKPVNPSGPARSLFDSPMTEITLTYETACARIEEIIRRLDSGEAGLRETLELCQEGRRLVEFCAGELDAVGRGLEELKLDELVARLETGRAAA
jgi:exodeoxyribonuclease VII small subunit